MLLELVGRLPNGATADLPTGGVAYLFRVTGFDLGSLGADELAAAVQLPEGMTLGPLDETARLVVYVEAAMPAGVYTIAISLPDGRRAEVAFGHAGDEPALDTAAPDAQLAPAAAEPSPEATPTLPSPLSLTFAGEQTETGVLPDLPGTFRLFDFTVSGVDLNTLSTAALKGAIKIADGDGHRFSWGWQATGSDRLTISLRTDALPGVYTLTFTLRDGRTAQQQFTVHLNQLIG